jgi:hypothetical protein
MARGHLTSDNLSGLTFRYQSPTPPPNNEIRERPRALLAAAPAVHGPSETPDQGGYWLGSSSGDGENLA